MFGLPPTSYVLTCKNASFPHPIVSSLYIQKNMESVPHSLVWVECFITSDKVNNGKFNIVHFTKILKLTLKFSFYKNFCVAVCRNGLLKLQVGKIVLGVSILSRQHFSLGENFTLYSLRTKIINYTKHAQ